MIFIKLPSKALPLGTEGVGVKEHQYLSASRRPYKQKSRPETGEAQHHPHHNTCTAAAERVEHPLTLYYLPLITRSIQGENAGAPLLQRENTAASWELMRELFTQF